jgi:hypothetical protein
MKKYFKFLILLFLIFAFTFTNADFTNDELLSSYNKVLQIKSWDKYIKSIDLIMNKYREDEIILSKIKSRLEEIDKIISTSVC